MSGINLNATIRMAFAFGGLLAGVAAFIFALYYGRPFGQNGAQSGLFAFTAAMLGGTGNPFGALASALLLGICASFSDYFISVSPKHFDSTVGHNIESPTRAINVHPSVNAGRI